MQFEHTNRRHLLAANVKGGSAPNFSTIALLLVVIISHAGGQQGEFQVKLSSIANPRGTTANGGCCHGSAVGGTCPSPCRTFFTICLYQLSRKGKCTFGMKTTKPILKNSFVLPGNTSLFRLPFRFSWPKSFTLEVTAKHHLGPNLSKEIENIVIKGSVLPGPQWHQVTQGKVANVTFSYRVLCDKNYYGNSCAIICEPRDDSIGHWTCDENGNKVCRKGWTGESCTSAICSKPCANGHCVSPDKCKCLDGWQGDQCNECKTFPSCVHGSCTKPWECNCDPGWGGRSCDYERDRCGKRKPCVKDNTKVCNNIGLGRYKCVCKRGYEGEHCEKEVNECQPKPCKNGGKCTDLFADFNCTCPRGFTGRRCQRQECRPSLCKNGGACVEGHANVTCMCPAEFTGRACDVRVSTTPTMSRPPGRADNSSAIREPGDPGKRTKIAVVVAPIFGLIFIVCVVLLICCRKKIKIFKCCSRTTEVDESQKDKDTRSYENRDPEVMKDCDGDMQCRVMRPARTPEIIINFEPTRQTGKNVNHFQNSGKEEKEWKESKPEGEETAERIDEKERRRKELQEKRRAQEKEEEENRERGKQEKPSATGISLALKDIRKTTNPSCMMQQQSYEKGFWQEVELEI